MLLQRKSLGFVAPSGVKYLSFMLSKCVNVTVVSPPKNYQNSLKRALQRSYHFAVASYHFELALTKLRQLLSFVTSVYTSTPTSRISMRSYVTQTVSIPASPYCVSCEASAGPFLSVLQSLVTSLVLTRLDHGNATLAGIPMYLLKRLQSVMNSASRCLSATAELLVLPTYYDETNCIGPV